MVLAVRRAVAALGLQEPVRTHATALVRRLAAFQGLDAEVGDAAAWVAGVEYLAARVDRPELEAAPVAARHGVAPGRMLQVLDALREGTAYRAYVGEWIRDGCPLYADEPEAQDFAPAAEDDALDLEALVAATGAPEPEEEPIGSLPSAGRVPRAPVDLEVESGDSEVPSRWQAPFLPYPWQYEAARAWEQNNGHGIMQVVTGAGKTALAIYLYARLLDQVEAAGHEVQLVVVVPRIELARQWSKEVRSLLKLTGLRLGQYHSELKCHPARQDILIITQDSARRLLPTMKIDRPVMLVADECHRLGAPAASQVLQRDYSWTLGLSATPERGGDLAFEEILVPRLGPVVWKYGYREAVRDGIIARFTIQRIKVRFTDQEQVEYNDLSEKVRRLLDGLKGNYPALRSAQSMRFWQIMGDLRKRNRDDQRFDMLTAAANQRRAIVHYAEQKLAVVKNLAESLGPPTKVLCFHERIEAADQLNALCVAANRRVAIYHSQIQEPARSENLARFRDGRADWLVACKSLDEGLDIPAVDTVVIVAGTRSPRQLIQRLGRALRRKGEDRAATIFLVEVAGVDDAALDQEGLGELSDAAEAVIETQWDEPGSLPGTDWSSATATTLRPTVGGARADRVRVNPLVRSSGALPHPGYSARKPLGRSGPRPTTNSPGLLNQLRSWGSALRERFSSGSWTGTPGNKSYYDKDSSPD